MQEEEQIMSLLREITNRLSVKLNQVYAPYGLTAVQFEILAELSFHDKQKMSELAQHLAMSNSNLSAIVKRLEAHGFLERVRDPMDQRSVHVALCQPACELMNQMKQNACRNHTLFADVPQADRSDILTGLQKLNQILKECEASE